MSCLDIDIYRHKNYVLNKKKKKSLTLRDICNDFLKPSIIKTYSVSFNNDAELPYKKGIKKKDEPFWINFV